MRVGLVTCPGYCGSPVIRLHFSDAPVDAAQTSSKAQGRVPTQLSRLVI